MVTIKMVALAFYAYLRRRHTLLFAFNIVFDGTK